MTPAEKLHVAVLGAGSFGTAIAALLAKNGHAVALWTHDPSQAEAIRRDGENRRYHPGIALPPGIWPTADMGAALKDATLVVAVAPSHVTRAVLGEAVPQLRPDACVVCATKGIEIDSGMLMSELLDQVLPSANRERAAFLSGPSFAKEMMLDLPTVVTVASAHEDAALMVQRAFNSERFRVYTTHDVVGVEVAGAVKNVMAIAAGIADGLGFGANTRAALITRGLAEMTRLGLRLGAQPVTFMGLAGMGDLVLTCTGDLSRNRNVGLRLGRGETLAEILAHATQVAEGVNTARAVHQLSQRLGVEMPIVEAVYQILYENKAAAQAVTELMNRPMKREQG